MQNVAMDQELASLLADLSGIQSDLLAVLTDKRARLLNSDKRSLDELQARESDLIVRLQACHERRLALLAQAAIEGLPSTDLKSLADSLPQPQRQQFAPQIR